MSDSKLACCYDDGTIYIWDLNLLSELPTQIKTNSKKVVTICFNKEGNTLFAGCADNIIYSFPASKEIVASQICGLIKRNMTATEWRNFVSIKDVTYERTCLNLPTPSDK